MRIKPKPYEFDWDGSCMPGGSVAFNSLTFSVGIFQWIPKWDGKGLKRGKVIRRIKGYSSKPDEVYKQAKQVCRELNANFERVNGRRT